MIAGDLLGERARLTPDNLALIEVRSGRRFSYADLDRCSATMAALWTGPWGLRKGDRVAILAENRMEYAAAFFACGKTGVVLVPLSSRLSVLELADIIADAGPRAVLFSRTFGQALSPARERGVMDPRSGSPAEHWITLEDLDLGCDTTFTPVPCSPEDLWCLLYTSGTTGRPKGVMLPHRMILWNAFNTVVSWQLREDDIAPIFTPMYHAGGLSVFLAPLVAIGGTIVLHERFDASEVWQAIERERATLIFAVPTIFKMLADAPEFATADLSHVRWAISGGAPLPRYLIDQYQQRGLIFKQGYGLTEAGVNCFAMTAEDASQKAGSIGKPMLFAETSIRDSQGNSLPPGETGELWLRGPHVCQGFWSQPDATAAAFTADGWLRTGDLAHCDADGFYFIDGRIKEMFITGGVNVYPAEIENLLLQDPAVQDAAVLGVPDSTWGEAGVAFLVARAGAPLSEAGVREFLEPKLARFKLPRAYFFLDVLPRTPYGKVLKSELRQWYQGRLK